MNQMYHLHTTAQNVAPYVLLPGDPHRVPIVASHWDYAEKIAENREHVTYTGTYKGMPVSCTSTGMGCPSTAIAVEELARCGAHTMLRMGTGAALKEGVSNGDILIFDSAYRADGTTKMYVPEGYPAVTHYEVLEGMLAAVKELDLPFHVGTSYCRDALYTNRANINTSFGGYHPHSWDTFMDDLRQTNVIATEMESAAVMVLTRLFGLRGGALCVNVIDFTKTDTREIAADFSKEADYSANNIDRLCIIACESMYQIYLNDQKKTQNF